MSDTIKCPHCNGKGRITLTGIYADTLKLLRSMQEPVTGHELARMEGCRGTAMCNRLVALERYGFAKSKRYGRKRLWEAK